MENMESCLIEFQNWITEKAKQDPYFAGTFWLVLSALEEPLLARALRLQAHFTSRDIPCADAIGEVIVEGRKANQTACFWHLPFHHHSIHIFFSLLKPSKAVRFAYRFIGRARGKAQLFPLGHSLIRSCARLNAAYPLERTQILRGISYPSRPEDGGAEINLKPGNAIAFLQKVEDDRRVLKSARMRVPVDEGKFCEFTIGRIGYISYHRGTVAPLLDAILGRLSNEMVESARPFTEAGDHFVGLRFQDPIFGDNRSFKDVLQALARLPRMSMALIHANPYFHATLTNYEDGGEFDIFITDPSTIHLKSRGETSPASFLRLHNNLSEVFREAQVSIEQPKRFSLSDLLSGRV